MLKRILSLALALLMLLSAASSFAEISPLSAQEIEEALRMISLSDGDQPWREGDAVLETMNAVQVRQYLSWLLSDEAGGLIARIQDGIQLLDMAQEGKSISLQGVSITLQQLYNRIAFYRDDLEARSQSVYNDLYRLSSAENLSAREEMRIALRVREDVSSMRRTISAVANYYSLYHTALENGSTSFASLMNAADTPDGALTGSASEQLLAEAKRLTDEEQANIDSQNGVDFEVLVLSSKQFGFIVRDSAGKPMKDASVTVSSSSKPAITQTAKTNAEGLVTFLIMDYLPDEKNRVTVNAIIKSDYYCTREMRTLSIRGGSAETVRMDLYAGQPYLRMAGYNGTDILSQKTTIYYSPKNNAEQVFDILIDSFSKTKISGFLYLTYQVYDADGNIVAKEDRRSFTSGAAVTFNGRYAQLIVPGSSVGVRVETNSFSKEYQTQLTVEKAVVDEPQFLDTNNLSFTGGNLSLTFPSSIPFIGGSKLSLDMPWLPAQLMIDPTGYIMFAYGKDFKSEELNWKHESSRDVQQRADDANRQAQRDAHAIDNQVYKNAGATDKVKFLGEASASVTVFAGLQGHIKPDATRFSLTGAGGIQSAFKGGYGWQFLVAGGIPIFAALDYTFSIGESFGLGLEADRPNLGNARFLFNKGQGLTVDLLAELGVSAGVGIRGLLNIALRFFGNIAPKLRLTNPTSAAVSLGMGLDVTVQAFVAKWKENLWKGTYAYDSAANGDSENASEGAAQIYTQIQNGVNTPSAADALPIALSGDGLPADKEEEIFSRLDSLAGEIQYATLKLPGSGKSATFGFWITPTTGSGDRKGELVWYNLDNPANYGRVYPETGGDSWRATEATDYAFATMAHGDVVGVTILSGIFEDRKDGKPTQSRMTVAVMQAVELPDGTLGLGISNTAGTYKAEVTRATGGEWGGYSLSTPIMYLTNNAPRDANRNLWFMNAGCNCEWLSTGETKGIVTIDIERTASGLQESPVTDLNPEFGDYTSDPATITRALSAARPTNAKFDGTYVGNDKSLSCYYRLKVMEKRTPKMNEDTGLFIHLNGTKQKLDSDVVYFAPLVEYGALPDAQEFIFYLKQGQADDGSDCYRLMGASRIGNGSFAICDYDVPLYSGQFKITTVNDGSPYGITYLYWTESAGTGEYESAKKYEIKCVRFDRETNTMSAPFTLVELSEHPESLHLMMDGTGYYTTAMKTDPNAESAAVSQRLIRFTFSLQTAVELTGVVSYDPCVCAGEYATLLFAVKNIGNLPVSKFMVGILAEGATEPLQTVLVDCSNPETNSVNTLFGARDDSAYSVTRVSGIYDDLNGDSWLTTTFQNGNAVAEYMHTNLLMPGGVHTYQASFKVPEDWNGAVKLTAELGNLFALTHYSGSLSGTAVNASDTEYGFDADGNLVSTNANAPSLIGVRRANVSPADMEKHIELGRGDLTLDCQAYVDSEGKEFVRVSITGRSETSSRIAPTLTAARNGNTVFSYTFVRAIDEDFGYTLDIPAERLLGGANGGEIVFTITDNDSGNEFADFDNQRSVTLGKTLVIIRQPEDQYKVEGQTATFYVIAEGTGLTYQWYINRNQGAGWKPIDGATGASYTTSILKKEYDGFQYGCLITDATGAVVQSDVAVLHVSEPVVPPATGDSSTPTLWLAMCILGAAGLMVIARRRRRA